MKVSISKIINITLILLLAYIVILNLYRSESIDKCHINTIATPIKITGGFRNGYSLHYKYSLKGNTYTSFDGIDKAEYLQQGDHYYISKRYYVQVDCNNLSSSRLVFDKKVPDTLVNIPENGWTSIPDLK